MASDTTATKRVALRWLSDLADIVIPSNAEYYDGAATAEAGIAPSSSALDERVSPRSLYEIPLDTTTSTLKKTEMLKNDAAATNSSSTPLTLGQVESHERSRLFVYAAIAVAMLVVLFLAIWLLSLERGG
jgi:hypothetical protein